MTEQQTQEKAGDLAVVVVDQWGHKGEFLRGDIIRLSELDSASYDAKSALDRNVIRLLTDAEVARPPTTQSVEGGDTFNAAMRYHAGMLDEVPTTTTTASGPAEPAEFAKPTMAYTGDNAPAPRPIQIVGEAEAQANTTPRLSAPELVARARAATTAAELDEIDGQADARMTTVHEAVAQRRAELAQEG
jgi:hypothetical protein